MNIALIRIGMEKHKTRDFPNSIKYFSQAILEYPHELINLQLYLFIGEAKYKLSDFEGSINSYTTGLNFYNANKTALENENPQQTILFIEKAYYIRANGKAEIGDLYGAIEDYNSCLELNPSLSDAIYSRGVAYMETNNYTSAIKDFTKIVSLNPNDAQAYRNLGDAKINLGDFNGAITDYTKAIEYSVPLEYLSDVYGSRAVAFAAKEQYQKAMSDIDRSLEINPTNHQVLLNKQELKRKLDQLSELKIKHIPHNNLVRVIHDSFDNWFKFNESPTITEIEAEIINLSTFIYLRNSNKIEFNLEYIDQEVLNSLPSSDIEVANQLIDLAVVMHESYTEIHAINAKQAVIMNSGSNGIEDFLKSYYISKHRISTGLKFEYFFSPKNSLWKNGEKTLDSATTREINFCFKEDNTFEIRINPYNSNLNGEIISKTADKAICLSNDRKRKIEFIFSNGIITEVVMHRLDKGDTVKYHK